MKKFGLLIIILSFVSVMHAQISITTTSFTYNQDFSSLSNTGAGNTWTNNSTIAGWYSSLPTYSASTGSSTTGIVYSYGAATSTERALGSQSSNGTGTIYYGVQFINNIANPLTQIRINYIGEQWRNGGNTTQQKLDFQYSLDATTLTNGTWVDVNELDFIGPIATATAGALDGNALGNYIELQATINLNVASGALLWFRWQDLNDTGNDHGLAIDNFLIDNLLPVELTSFSATTIGNNVKLNWNTATEVNNYGFEVERKVGSLQSTVGNYKRIGFVNGNGNSSSPKDYSFVDNKVSTGKYSYRLKQIDNDGQFEYSKSIEVDMSGVKKFELSQNYPNPFNPSTTIKFNLPEAGMVKLTLFNILGQQIRTIVNEFKESGTHTINFDASDLNSGMYIYKIESGSFVQTRKMTLIK
jgi:hypothetical protein